MRVQSRHSEPVSRGLLALGRVNHVSVRGELAWVARAGRQWPSRREESPAPLEHERECRLVRAIARAREFHAGRVARVGFCDSSH